MNRLIIIFTLVFMSLHAEAQRGPGAPPGMSVEQVQIERIAYFTEQIGLTPEEAQLFWPLYNEMDNKRKALFEEKAAMLKSFTENKNTNDKQINEQLNRLAAINGQECALHGEYDAKFRKMMSAQKVMNMYIAEIGFRNYLLQKIRKRRDSE